MPGKREVAIAIAAGLAACLLAEAACGAVAAWVEGMVAAMVVVQ